MDRNEIEHIVQSQRKFYASGKTRSYHFRKQQLLQLKESIKQWESELYNALLKDLHKAYEEALLTEISILNSEIDYHLSHLKRWMKVKRCAAPLKLFPSRYRIVTEPLGSTLIIAPWNYPVQLLLNPLVGAISAGCTAILKPSPYVPHVSQCLAEMIANTFSPDYITVIQGDREVNTQLLQQRFDLIFFTGSPRLGKVVMRAASENLTPVVLELGGKSPCIVDATADIELAARRIAWGKCVNAGQTCIAPDYLLIHQSVKSQFISAYQRALQQLFGDDVQASCHYGRIVNKNAFERIAHYLHDGIVVLGGACDANDLYIAPTLLDGVEPDSAVMQEEIFGPILPMLTFSTLDEVISFINQREKALALYYFGRESDGEMVVQRTSAGGSCINDVIMQIANERVPFGGVGNSGMGCYHGYNSFKTFSHERTLLYTPTWIDVPFRYMPYRMMSIVKKFL